MFEYKRPISSIIDGPRFITAQIGNVYCVVAPVNNFYKVYSAEKLSTLGRCREEEKVQKVTVLGRYIITVTGTSINIYNHGVQIQKIDLKRSIKDLLAYEDFFVISTEGKVMRIDLCEIEKIEDQQLRYIESELKNIPEGDACIHKLALKNKMLIVANGSMHIYSLNKNSVVYTLKCFTLNSPVIDISNSLSPDIIAVATEKEIAVVHLKKDILLQKFLFSRIHSIDFRRSPQCKELAVLAEKEVFIICLEEAVVTKKHMLRGNTSGASAGSSDRALQTVRYIGTDGYLVISQSNELQILDAHREKIVQVKRRAGVVFGEHQCCEFLKDTLVVSTNRRIYTLSLRKEEQLREFSKMNAEGHPVSLSVVRENILACYSKGVYSLIETVGGVTEKKRKLGHSTPKEYLEAVLSFCGNSMVLGIKDGPGVVKILIASRESGFILGEIAETPYIALSLNNIKKTLTVLHARSVTVYSYNGEVLSKRSIVLPEVAESDTQAEGAYKGLIGKVVETRAYKYCILATESDMHIFTDRGELIKRIRKMKGKPLKLRISTDLEWILLLSEEETGSILEVFDIESACALSSTALAYVPQDFVITHNKSRLIVTTDKQILLFTNTYSIKSTASSSIDIASQGISFTAAHKSRIRLLLMYDEVGVKVEEEGVLAPYTMQKENIANLLSSKPDAQMTMDALLDGNYPISMIIAHIKKAEDPTALAIALIEHLETKYDIAEALLNRVLHYRRKDLDMERLIEPLQRREAITERFITTYLSTLSLIRNI